MVMTMPDLGTYDIKRSKAPVHYVYVYHSLVSSHMCYRLGAFDQFDAILCVGPHHKEEIESTEALYNLKPKILIEAGYGRLDAILGSEADAPSHSADGQSRKKRVLVAPSWGENSLLENHGPELVEALLGTAHHITVRPHVMTIRHRRKLLGQLQKRFGSNPDFALDISLGSQGVMHQYDLLVADWGGSALEYAFGLERPVLFVDVPRKVFNPEYECLSCVPIEIQVRSEIGDIVSPDRLQEVPERISRMLKDPEIKKQNIIEARSRWVYNLGSSGKVGAEYISKTADRLRYGTNSGGDGVVMTSDR
jgi:YidC/Oxa1 family membrane protein insertase